MRKEPPVTSSGKQHVQGGQPCWCGYQGMGLNTDRKPRFAAREDGKDDALYGRGKR